MQARIKNLMLFLFLFFIEVLIALFVHDSIIRPYVGDILVVCVLYFFVKIFVIQEVKGLPLYVFLFAAVIEFCQYFDFVTLLGLEKIPLARIVLGSTFDWMDIFCYLIGACLLLLWEKQHRGQSA